MKRYVKNVLIYVAALLGIIAFISLFSSSLQSYDEIKGRWGVYSVSAYLGESYDGNVIYKGTIFPIFGFILPLIAAIFLIVESFQPQWNKSITIINTVLAVVFFFCAITVLLTKELFLKINNLGDTLQIRNGGGPIVSAICSTLAGSLLLFVAWVPADKKLSFIEK